MENDLFLGTPHETPQHSHRYTIRTSDRRLFRRCFRKWGYLSSLRGNLEGIGSEQNIHFWFGSGIHFALEDYHGWNKFGDPRRAFKAYYDSFKSEDLPEGAADYYELGLGMLSHYIEWYPTHNSTYEMQTLWLDDNLQPKPAFSEGAHPAVEQQFILDLGIKAVVNKQTQALICEYTDEVAKKLEQRQVGFILGDNTSVDFESWYEINGEMVQVEIIPICYHGTMDKICVDMYGRWWITDYKTAKGADTAKLDTDDQISAYLWAAEQWYHHPIYGFAYLQLTKAVPHAPNRNKDCTLSVNKKQLTTYYMFKQELADDYGPDLKGAPSKYIEMLNYLADQETPEGDAFIRWDFVQRSANQTISTYNNIIGETKLMLRPDLYLFPNPTRDCSWDCPLREACIAQDDGRSEEVKFFLDTHFKQRPRGEEGNHDEWRDKIKWPAKDTQLTLGNADEFGIDPDKELHLILPDEYFEGFEHM